MEPGDATEACPGSCPSTSPAVELQDEALAITLELGMRLLTEPVLARRDILRA